MTKVATTIRIEAELRASLNKICVRTGDQTYHIEQALRAYGPIKKLTAKEKVLIPSSRPTPNFDNEMFDTAWGLYEKKGNRKTSLAKFLKLKASTMQDILNHIPLYVLSTPDKQFRKDFQTYLNQECWYDEITERKELAPIESFVDKHTNKTWQDEIIARDEG